MSKQHAERIMQEYRDGLIKDTDVIDQLLNEEIEQYPYFHAIKLNRINRLRRRATPYGRMLYALHLKCHREEITPDQLMQIADIVPIKKEW